MGLIGWTCAVALVLGALSATCESTSASSRKQREAERRRVESLAARRRLREGGVGRGVRREVVGMAGQSMTRQDIVAHVGSHYPHKTRGELNDIVVASTISGGRPLPKLSATRAAEERARLQNQREFDAAKKRLGALVAQGRR